LLPATPFLACSIPVNYGPRCISPQFVYLQVGFGLVA